MTSRTEQATLTDPNDAQPTRVSLWASDSNGVLRSVQVGTDGQLVLNLTGEGLALDVSVDGLEALIGTSNTALAAIQGYGTTITSTATRAADTNAYVANDAWSDSASAPTAGGYTLTGMGRASGGSGIISDILIVSSNDPATLLQGELWLFDSAPTAINDNAAFALSDADAIKLVAVIPFTLVTSQAGSGTNSIAHITGINVGYTCVGSANLRYLVKVKNAYTPANAESLTIRAKIQYTT